jgi:Uma2 family endonuclease
MAAFAKRPATYEDLLRVPETKVAEIVNGTLYEFARPRTTHVSTTSTLGEILGPPFKRGRGGPGGWVILDEPELHLGADILVPDLAGWRRERMPELPDAPFLTLAPDWVCEVLSPSTAAIDRSEKLPIYGAHGVKHLWFIDPAIRTLEILTRERTHWSVTVVFSGDAGVRAEPFEAIELSLGELWAR